MSDKIRVVIKAPGTPACTTFIDNDLKTLQDIVGGYIEVFNFYCVPNTVCIVNEEGKLQNLEPNFIFDADCVVGTAIFASTAGAEFSDLGVVQASEVKRVVNEHLPDASKGEGDLPF